ncbi:hypothetical protein QOU41_27830, partial [Pseudomonas aeruginosa]
FTRIGLFSITYILTGSLDLFRGSLERLLTDESAYLQMSFAHNPYGDGEACQRIVQALLV